MISLYCTQIEGRQVAGLDVPTTKSGVYKTSLIVRRRIEQIAADNLLMKIM